MMTFCISQKVGRVKGKEEECRRGRYLMKRYIIYITVSE